MITSRTYHALHLDIASYPSDRICYVILPEKLKESEHQWLEEIAESQTDAPRAKAKAKKAKSRSRVGSMFDLLTFNDV